MAECRTYFINILFYFILFIAIHSSNSKQDDRYSKNLKNSISSKYNSLEKKEITLSSGLVVKLSLGPSYLTLSQWAKDLEKSGGAISHRDAMNREFQVVSLINSGEWDINTYHEYQRLVAGSGNVDSARLLIEYGIEMSISESMSMKESILSMMLEAIMECNLKRFKKIIADENHRIEMITKDGTSILMATAYSGCVSILNYILDEGVDDIDAVGVNGLSTLMIASSLEHNDIINLLFEKSNPTIDYPHKFAGNTALHIAAEFGNADTIALLCKYGANPNAITSTGSTPLHVYASIGPINNKFSPDDVIGALIHNCSADIMALLNGDTTALYLAAQNGHHQIVESLLLFGANPNFAMPFTSYKGNYHIIHKFESDRNRPQEKYYDIEINSEAGNGASAIHAAAEEGRFEVIKVFIKYSKQENLHRNATIPVDINNLSMGISPLHSAVQYNHPDIVLALIEGGADIDILSLTDGSTPLYSACGHGHNEIVNILIAKNASLTKRQKKSGGFPLLYATIRGEMTIIRQLIEAGAPLEDSTKDGWTAFHAAAIGGQYDIVKYLLSKVEDMLLNDRIPSPFLQLLCREGSDGDSILHATIRGSYEPIAKLLISFLTKYSTILQKNSCNMITMKSKKDHSTALHIACQYGLHSIIKTLIEYGGSDDINTPWKSKDMEIVTPLILCIRSGSVESSRVLVEAGAHLETESTITMTTKSSKVKQIQITSLLVAIDMRNEAIVDLLLVHGANPDHGIKGGGVLEAPLLFAVIKGSASIVKRLLDANASCSIVVAGPTSDGSHDKDNKREIEIGISKKR